MKRFVGISAVVVIGVSLIWWAVQLMRGPDASMPLPMPLQKASAVQESVPEAPAPNVPAPRPVPKPPTTGQLLYAYTPPSPELTPPANVERLARAASAGLLVDVNGRRILYAKRADELVPIASMTKLMTLLVVLREMQTNPQITMDMQITASRAAASMGGTQVWLSPGEVASLHDLLVALMVQSANDAAYAIGEGVAPSGDIEQFVAMMNRTARDIGMRRARYYNPHGLPGARMSSENRSSCMDMAVLALELQKYPLAMQLVGTRTADFTRPGREPLQMRNHNKLLFSVEGVNGMKTGFSNRAGFCLTATAERNGQRLIAVGTGFNNKDQRNAYVEGLLEWGFTLTLGQPAP